MKTVTMADDQSVNILAFFNVVASSQISPHFPFGRQSYIKFLTYSIFDVNKLLKRQKLES